MVQEFKNRATLLFIFLGGNRLYMAVKNNKSGTFCEKNSDNLDNIYVKQTSVRKVARANSSTKTSFIKKFVTYTPTRNLTDSIMYIYSCIEDIRSVSYNRSNHVTIKVTYRCITF